MRLIYEFAAWMEISEDTLFCNLERNKEITAKEWLALPEEERGDYVLKSIADAWKESVGADIVDGNFDIEE